MKKSVIVLLVFMSLIMLMGCVTPSIVVSPDLTENAEVLEVSGRQGFQFNQVVTFGDYKTSEIKRGWGTGGRVNLAFVADYEFGNEELSFTQYSPSGKSAEVYCLTELENVQYQPSEFLNDAFSIDMSIYIGNKDIFTGSVIGENATWDFVLHNPDNNRPFMLDGMPKPPSGEIVNRASNEKITILPVYKIENQLYLGDIEVFGYEFFSNNESIAAVSLLNNGRVWFNNELTEDTKLALASIMTGLMVRHSITFDN